MRVENARRLTGRGFFSPEAGAVVELWLDPDEDPTGLERRWRQEALDPLLAAIGLDAAPRFFHRRATGLTTAVGAPIDRLYALADALEWAGLSFAGQAGTSLADAAAAYREQLADEANPALLALEAAARERGTPFLWDDDAVSLGLGCHGETFSRRELPDLESVAWDRYRTIPVGLVTGTNGKTTTTRMAAFVLREAGYRVGVSSTDAIIVGGRAVDQGDWTGPGAARKVLRHPDVTAAVLETARGGLLRRGLAYEKADAALITNIGEDHFGDYGITHIEDMARTKAVVWKGVRPGGVRIANAGCPVSMASLAREHPGALGRPGWVLFGRDEDALRRHVAAGGEAWTATDGALTHHRDRRPTAVLGLDEIPATFGGAARHNVDNALAAAALTSALGADHGTIAAGLGAFGRRPEDNPGRMELHRVEGRLVLLDFGHNAHGVRSLRPLVVDLLGRSPGSRLMVVAGQAGDRSDHDIRELARAIMLLSPSRVALRPMRGYERGRERGEVEEVFRAALAEGGLTAEDNVLVEDEVAALEHALEWLRPGDLVLILVHLQRAEVRAWIESRAPA